MKIIYSNSNCPVFLNCVVLIEMIKMMSSVILKLHQRWLDVWDIATRSWGQLWFANVVYIKKTSRHGNTSRINGLLCRKSNHIRSPWQMDSLTNTGLWCLIYCSPEQAFEWRIELSLIWNVMTLTWRHRNEDVNLLWDFLSCNTHQRY